MLPGFSSQAKLAKSLVVSWFSQDAQGREGPLMGLGSILSTLVSEGGGLGLEHSGSILRPSGLEMLCCQESSFLSLYLSKLALGMDGLG